LLDKTETITSYQWTLLSRPANSNAQLTSTTEATTSFMPDSVGNYSITVEVTGSAGSNAAGSIGIRAISNQPPVAQFTLDKTELTLGDSVLADASASFDPDGDGLQYFWQGPGPIATMEDGRLAKIIPFSTGNQEILLRVQDEFAVSEAAQTITIHPKIDNMTADYSFVDSSWVRQIFFFNGDTLLVPMQVNDLIRVYDLTESGIVANTDIDVQNIVQILRLDENNHLYALKQGFSGSFGPGSLFIFSVGDQWQMTPLLEDYLPGTGDIVGITFTDETAFVRGFTTIYKIDFATDPSNPSILEKVDYLQHIRPRSISEVDPYLYIRVFDAMTGTNTVEVRNKSDLNLVQNLDLPGDPRTLTTHDTLMFVGFPDSLNIYSISNPLQPKLISKITVPVEKAPIADFANTLHRGEFIENDLLAVDVYGGINIFTIDNPQTPHLAASWYDGVFGQTVGLAIVHNNGSYFVTSKSGSIQSPNNPYSGINKITFGFAVSVEGFDAQTVPKQYRLHQNYPNPFNPTTTIRYELPKAGQVEIAVFNILGKKTVTLVDEFKPAGSHQVTWDASNVSTGVYFYRIKSRDFNKVKKLLLLR